MFWANKLSYSQAIWCRKRQSWRSRVCLKAASGSAREWFIGNYCGALLWRVGYWCVPWKMDPSSKGDSGLRRWHPRRFAIISHTHRRWALSYLWLCAASRSKCSADSNADIKLNFQLLQNKKWVLGVSFNKWPFLYQKVEVKGIAYHVDWTLAQISKIQFSSQFCKGRVCHGQLMHSWVSD